jgi:hypothetical protein
MERYYLAATTPTNLIDKARTKYDFPALYGEVEWLCPRLCRFREQENNGKKYEPPTKKAITTFLENEAQLIPPPKGEFVP